MSTPEPDGFFRRSAMGVQVRLYVFPRTNMDRFNINSQIEHLQSKYVGTGHADTIKYEWMTNQHRDSYASFIGHAPLLNYFSIAENECSARVKFNLMEKMLQPCGPPPPREEQ